MVLDAVDQLKLRSTILGGEIEIGTSRRNNRIFGPEMIAAVEPG